MSNQEPSKCFIITDAGGLNDSALESIPAVIYKLLKKSNFNLRQMDNSNELLLTLYSPSIVDSDFENRMMDYLEVDGSLVNVTQVVLESVLALKFESKKDFGEVMIELQLKDVFKDQVGNTKYIKALIGKKALLMVLVVLHSNYGIGNLYCDFSLIEGLVTVYRVKSLEFLKIFFGKCGTLENYIEKIWSDSKSDCKVAALIDSNYRHSIAPHHRTRVFRRKIPEKQECKTIAVAGEYASEKCELLQRFCHDFVAEDCNLTVNRDNKEVTITGKNMKMFRKSVFMIELQFKNFHCEVIWNMSKTFFNLLTRNKAVEKHFTRILAENKLDSVILLENGQKRPAVLGLNKFKTKNFIEWFERFFSKGSTKLEYFQNNVLSEELEKCFTSLELNSQTPVDMTNAKMLVRGLAPIKTNTLPFGRSYSEIPSISSSSLNTCLQLSTTSTMPTKTCATISEVRFPPQQSPTSTPTCRPSILPIKPMISYCRPPMPLPRTQTKCKPPTVATTSSVTSPSTLLSTIVTSSVSTSSTEQAPIKANKFPTNKPASASMRNSKSTNLNYSSSLPLKSNASVPKSNSVISAKTSDYQKRCRFFYSNSRHTVQFISPMATIASSTGKSTSMLSSKSPISSVSISRISSTAPACAISGSVIIKPPTTAPKNHFTGTASSLKYSPMSSSKCDSSTSTTGCKLSSASQASRSIKSQRQVRSLIQTSTRPSTYSNTLSSKASISCATTSVLKPHLTSPPICSNSVVSSKIYCPPSSSTITSKKLNSKTSPVALPDIPSSRNTASTFALTSESGVLAKTVGANAMSLEKDRNLAPLSNLKHSRPATTTSQIVVRSRICPSATSVKVNRPSENCFANECVLKKPVSVNITSLPNPTRESSTLQLQCITITKPRPIIKSSRSHLLNLPTNSSSSKLTSSLPCESPKSTCPDAKSLRPRPRPTELLHDSIKEFVHINAQEMLGCYFCVKLLLLTYKTLSKAI